MATHTIGVTNNPAPNPGSGKKYKANPTSKGIGTTAGDIVKWDLAGAPVTTVLLWFPNAQNVFEPPPGGFTFPATVKLGAPYELKMKAGLVGPSSFRYVMYDPVSGEFIQGNSEPQVTVP